MKNRILEEQQKICKQYSAQFTSSDIESIIGISDNTNGINVLLNGLRHQPKDNNSGWYIWSGKELSQNEDFFKPLRACTCGARMEWSRACQQCVL